MRFVLVGLAALTAGCGAVTSQGPGPPATAKAPSAPSPPAPSAASAPSPTAPPVTAFPPKTEAGLKALAGEGDPSAVHGFKSETVGLAPCPQPKLSATLDPALPVRQIAADMLAAFYDRGMAQKCGALLLAYKGATYGEGYDVGRVNLDGSDLTGGKNKLTVNVVTDVGETSFEVDY